MQDSQNSGLDRANPIVVLTEGILKNLNKLLYIHHLHFFLNHLHSTHFMHGIGITRVIEEVNS